jgi:hypothetical protein
MRQTLIAAAVLAVVMAAALPAAVASTRSFETPSGNIACMYFSSGGPGAFVRCDVRSLNDTGFVVYRTSRARRIHVTDSVADPNRARVLGYGRSRGFGSFRCTSRRSGLTCRSTASGHGFTLSREHQRVF